MGQRKFFEVRRRDNPATELCTSHRGQYGGFGVGDARELNQDASPTIQG